MITGLQQNQTPEQFKSKARAILIDGGHFLENRPLVYKFMAAMFIFSTSRCLEAKSLYLWPHSNHIVIVGVAFGMVVIIMIMSLQAG